MDRVLPIGAVLVASLLITPRSAKGSAETIGPNGINSAILNTMGLDGSGVFGIGQVETNRPGRPNIDNALFANAFVVPAATYRRVANPPLNAPIDAHAEAVAGVMISTEPSMNPLATTGVSQGAHLYSSAADQLAGDMAPQVAAIIATQHVATRNGGDVRAINASFLGPDTGVHDGNSQYTLFVDWSASQHDVLYIVASRNATTPAAEYIPSDNFNGITVSSSEKVGGVYRQVSSFVTDINYDVEGFRTPVDILAPGRSVDVTYLANAAATVNGNSFATPHVVGTVALLQQYADQQIMAGVPKWDTDARRHEVMKAVIMNSADKLKDDGSLFPIGTLLGMERTVLKSNGTDTWLQSDAYSGFDADITPLDNEMGTGHLNAHRVFQQFQSGEWDQKSTTIPAVGWDYGVSQFLDDVEKYVFDQPLLGAASFQ